MTNTCQNCKWSYIKWIEKKHNYSIIAQLRCNLGGDKEQDKIADILCLKWQLKDGVKLESE